MKLKTVGALIILTTIRTMASSVDTLEIPLVASMVELLASPEKYNEKLIATDGYLEWDFEDHGLYLTKELAINGGFSSAIWVSSGKSLGWYENDIVRIVGIFRSGKRGQWGLYKGSIEVQKAYKLPYEIRVRRYFMPLLIFMCGVWLGWEIGK